MEQLIDLKSKLPNYLQTSEEYLMILDILNSQLGISKKLVDEFTDLVDLDTVPSILLPSLSKLVNYDYRYDLPVDHQRDIIKSIFHIYKTRGTNDSIIQAATYADNKHWIGGHIFTPDAIINEVKARLSFPIDLVFTWSKSDWSNNNAYADNDRYQSGIIVIKVDHFSDNIREAVRKVLPAGIKVFFDIELQLVGDGNLGQVAFGEWKIDTEVIHTMCMDPSTNNSEFKYDVAIYNGETSYYSGKQIIYVSSDSLSSLYSSFLFTDLPDESYPEDYYDFCHKIEPNEHDIIYKYDYYGMPRYNMDFVYDGKLSYSGTRLDDGPQEIARIGEIKPWGIYDDIEYIYNNLSPNDYIPFYCMDLVITENYKTSTFETSVKLDQRTLGDESHKYIRR